MPRQRRIEPFFIVVTDAEASLFNVLGPMTDDTGITHRVAALQDKGRKVNCYTADRGKSREQIIESSAKFHNLTYTDDWIAP